MNTMSLVLEQRISWIAAGSYGSAALYRYFGSQGFMLIHFCVCICVCYVFVHLILILHLKMYRFLLILFLRRGEEREKEGETSMCGCLSHAPHWGPSL